MITFLDKLTFEQLRSAHEVKSFFTSVKVFYEPNIMECIFINNVVDRRRLQGPHTRWETTPRRKRYQGGEAVLQSLHRQLHLGSDDAPVEVHAQGEVQVSGDASGDAGEGARV